MTFLNSFRVGNDTLRGIHKYKTLLVPSRNYLLNLATKKTEKNSCDITVKHEVRGDLFREWPNKKCCVHDTLRGKSKRK